MNVNDVVILSNLLGEMGAIKRAAHLPNGENEPDSHHAFSLALISYQIVQGFPELDEHKVVLFALVHDLLEIITGDDNTLHFVDEQLRDKQRREKKALKEFDTLFAKYPEIKNAMYEYDKLDTLEAATVFVLDKACTAWTHHADNGEHARTNMSLNTRADIKKWADVKRDAIKKRLKVAPPAGIMEMYEDSVKALLELYND